MRNNKNKGFTLVELLVVIAILAILATVSVVGYTSFIESATVSNDENIAAQLNQFLAAMKADSNGPFYGEEINENNVREVTEYILMDGGLDELVAQSAKYGYGFYYDLQEDKYVVLNEEESGVKVAGYKELIGFFGVEATGESEYEIKLENCFTPGNRYFYVGTPHESTPLAEIFNSFYSFTSTSDYTTLKTKVDGTGIQKLITFVTNSVVVTDDCNYRLGSNPTNVIFVNGVQSIGTTTKQWNGTAWETITVDNMATITGTLTIPNTVKYLAGNSLNVGSAATIVFNKAAAELGNMAFQHFTDATIKTNEGTYHSGTCTCGNANHTGRDVIVSDTDATVDVLLNFYNPASSFDMEVSEDVANKVLNNSAFAYVVYDKKTFDLNALNFVAGTYPELPSSTMNSDIVWSVENGSHAYVKSITDAGVVTLADTAPTTSCEITFIAKTPEGVELPFVVKVVAANGLSFSFDGVDMSTKDTISLFYGKVKDVADTYSLSNIKISYNYPDSEISGLDFADDVTFGNLGELFTANGTTLSVANPETGNGEQTITVNVGSYISKSILVKLTNYNKLNFVEKDDSTPFVDGDKVVYVGNNDPVYLEDLFNINSSVYMPENVQVWVINELGNLDCSSMTGVTQSELIETAKFNIGSDWAKTAVEFINTETDGGIAMIVIVAKGENDTYYRISEPVRVNVVDATNIRSYNDMKNIFVTVNNSSGDEDVSKSNALNNSVVLLNDITMDTNKQFFTINKTLYGNCFTIDIKNGRTTQAGIINLVGTIQDAKVIGKTYTTFSPTVSISGGSSAIASKNKNAQIINCYVYGCRSPLRLDAGCTVTDSMFFGGKYSNIEVDSGCTLTLKGTNYTINQGFDGQIGLGITTWFNDSEKVIDNQGTLIQYNFISNKNTNLPVIDFSTMGFKLDCNELFGRFMGKPDYASIYHDYDSTNANDEFFVNTGIVSLDYEAVNGQTGGKSTMTTKGILNYAGFAETLQLFDSQQDFDDRHEAMQKGICGLAKDAQGLYGRGISGNDFPCYLYSPTGANYASMYANSNNAQDTYKPWGADGKSASGYGFGTDGKIIP